MHQSMRYSPDAYWIAAGADKQQGEDLAQMRDILSCKNHGDFGIFRKVMCAFEANLALGEVYFGRALLRQMEPTRARHFSIRTSACSSAAQVNKTHNGDGGGLHTP
jgi:hypothetical protein